MFSFFIGLGIALFIAFAGFGGFLFKLSNANKTDMENNPFALPDRAVDTTIPKTTSEMEAEETLNRLDTPVSNPNLSTGSL